MIDKTAAYEYNDDDNLRDKFVDCRRVFLDGAAKENGTGVRSCSSMRQYASVHHSKAPLKAHRAINIPWPDGDVLQARKCPVMGPD